MYIVLRDVNFREWSINTKPFISIKDKQMQQL